VQLPRVPVTAFPQTDPLLVWTSVTNHVFSLVTYLAPYRTKNLNLYHSPLNFGSRVMYSLVPLSHMTVKPRSVSTTVKKWRLLIWNLAVGLEPAAPGSGDTTGSFSRSKTINVLLMVMVTFLVHVKLLVPQGTFWACIWKVPVDEPLQESCARRYSQAPLKVNLLPSKVMWFSWP